MDKENKYSRIAHQNEMRPFKHCTQVKWEKELLLSQNSEIHIHTRAQTSHTNKNQTKENKRFLPSKQISENKKNTTELAKTAQTHLNSMNGIKWC